MTYFSARFREGIALFNAGEFFEAHEALEDVWRESTGEDRRFLQGLVQVAVGLHHHSTGNMEGAQSVLARALENLRPYPDRYSGIRVDRVRNSVAPWPKALAGGQPAPPLPKIEVTGAKLHPPVDKAAVKHVGTKPAGVPLLDLRRQYAAIREEIAAAIDRVCSSQHFVLGEEIEAFERETSAYLGVSHTVGCASGTDALWLVLLGCGVKPGDEVITTPFSFFASASAITHAGARPVFVDVDPRTLNLDPESVEKKLSRNRRHVQAILPVHLYGQCADMDAFARIAAEHHITVIEDAAQAFGASWRGRRAGTLGSAAAFSFYPTKNLSAYGDGGCLSTNDGSVSERTRLLRNHGGRTRYHHDEMGWNSRLDAIQAAILRVKLHHLDQWNAMRREHAARYDALFRDAGLTSGSEHPPVRPLETLPGAFHIFHQYVIRASRRDELRAFLTGRNIGTEVYYPIALHLQPAFAYLGYTVGDLPEAERAATEVIALPMFPELRNDEQGTVVEAIAEFYS
ncbi:MAG: aminotransferase class V-fold PLP-dependent enzyme [Acidobacteriaceae bacterium]|nr:aminotransferase class V-fold PLP-dependent enzyme [Acidobacteriaceae bacterium]